MARRANDPAVVGREFAKQLPPMVETVAASIVGFSGYRTIAANDDPAELVYEDSFEMLLSGYYCNLGRAFLAPTSQEIINEPIYLSTYQTVAAFLCLVADNTGQEVMEFSNAERFGQALHVAAANLFAGRNGFNPDARATFEKIQEIIPTLFSGEGYNRASPGRGDALGKILDRVRTTSDGKTAYAFVVGSEKQTAGCGTVYLAAINAVRNEVIRCVTENGWSAKKSPASPATAPATAPTPSFKLSESVAVYIECHKQLPRLIAVLTGIADERLGERRSTQVAEMMSKMAGVSEPFPPAIITLTMTCLMDNEMQRQSNQLARDVQRAVNEVGRLLTTVLMDEGSKKEEVSAQMTLLTERIINAVGDFEDYLLPLVLAILLDNYSKFMIDSVASGRV